MNKKFRGLLLDVDGTLIDSNEAHTQAWVQAFEKFGHTIEPDQIRRRIGMGGDKLVPAVSGLDPDGKEAKELSKYRSQLFKDKFIPELKAFPRTKELLAELRHNDIQLVIATSAKTDELKPMLKQTGLADSIDHKTTASDAENSKPDPDIIEAALKKIGLKAEEVFMVGDTPYDIEAAAKANIRTIGFTCGGLWKREELLKAGAYEVYSGPEEFLREYQTLFAKALRS